MTSRDYAKVSPTFWTGATGSKLIAAGPLVITVALYLVTGPHAEPTGLYRLPRAYVEADLRIDIGSIDKAMGELESIGWLETDGDRQLVWVREMGHWQVGDVLGPRDNRRKWVKKRLDPYISSPLYRRFWDRYGEPWGLPEGP